MIVNTIRKLSNPIIMTLDRFKELWFAQFGNTPMKLDMQPQTIHALIAASNGDFSYFDKVKALLVKIDNERISLTTKPAYGSVV